MLYFVCVVLLQIVCNTKENVVVDHKTQHIPPDNKIFIFNGFVKNLNPGFGVYPPFDFVSVSADGKNFYYSQLEGVDFILTKIDTKLHLRTY